MRTEYKYQVGEVVNETLKIVSKTRKKEGKYSKKAYEVQSLVYSDAPTYVVDEYSLNKGVGCSYSRRLKIYVGNSLYSIEHIRPYLVDIEEAKTIAPKSNKKYKFKCPECSITKSITPNTLVSQGFSCPLCSKGTSYPELFMLAYLEVKGIEYEYQKVFDDLPNRRFDFYLPKENKVIEIHGRQHYSKTNTIYNYSRTKDSDKEKIIFCKDNNILYTEVNAKDSSFTFIRDSIRDSGLPDIDLKEEILILNIIENNKRYPVKRIIELYKKGNSITDVGETLGIHEKQVYRVLKLTNTKRVNKKKGCFKRGSISPNRRRIKCVTTNREFISIEEACRVYGLKVKSNISSACRGKRNYAGTYKGKKLQWEYVD